MSTSTAPIDAIVRFKDRLWSVETRIGGVYQLRAANGETRLARRSWFTVTDTSKGVQLTDKPSNDISGRTKVRVIPISRDAAPGRYASNVEAVMDSPLDLCQLPNYVLKATDIGPSSVPRAAHVTDDFIAGLDSAD